MNTLYFAFATMLATRVHAPKDHLIAPFGIRGRPTVLVNALEESMKRPPVSVNLRLPSFYLVDIEYPYSTGSEPAPKGMQSSNDNVKVRG
jgi:hypothetical protein